MGKSLNYEPENYKQLDCNFGFNQALTPKIPESDAKLGKI